MKAIICTDYGTPDVLQLQEVEKPVPKENEILIRIKAVSVNFGDLMARNFKNISARKFNMPFLIWAFARLAFGINKPRIGILGNSFSGEIESVGKKVRNFSKGETVFGYSGEKMGAYAEFLCLPANGIVAHKPAELSFQEASALPYGHLMAINLLRKVKIAQNQKVLVVGASGSIGSAAVQLLKNYFGAQVSGVCSVQRMSYVKTLGADTVFDYKTGIYNPAGETYDMIVDVLGKGSYSNYKSMLNKNGKCLYASFKSEKLVQMFLTRFSANKKVVCAMVSPDTDDLLFVKKLVEEGKIKSVIDKCFPLEQAALSHEYIEKHNNRGNVIITIQDKHNTNL